MKFVAFWSGSCLAFCFPKDPSVNLECLSCLVALMITHDDIKKARVHPLIHISSNLKPHWYISMLAQVDSVQCIVTFKATMQKIICLLDYCIDTHFRGKTSIILASLCVCGLLLYQPADKYPSIFSQTSIFGR